LDFNAVCNQKEHMLQHAIFFVLIFFSACTHARADDAPKPAPHLGFSVVHIFPHDISHYTEGLVLHDGKFLESAGRYGESALYETEIETGKTLRLRKIDARFFAEGIAVAHDRIVQLTWREQTAFIYDLAFNPIGTLSFAGEGWGLASFDDGKELVMSDGTPTLRFIDADSYQLLRKITVHDGPREIMRLNELESANGLVYANVWLTDTIATIDPADGRVVGWLDLSRLQTLFKKPANWDDADDVLNGIAFDPRTGHFYITGKCWPVLFEIAVEQPKHAH
jgi:glutamine cyclotransferase